jgi:hypothetical protein
VHHAYNKLHLPEVGVAPIQHKKLLALLSGNVYSVFRRGSPDVCLAPGLLNLYRHALPTGSHSGSREIGTGASLCCVGIRGL